MLKPIQLHCHASTRGIDACMVQSQDNTGTAFRSVTYASKPLHKQNETRERATEICIWGWTFQYLLK